MPRAIPLSPSTAPETETSARDWQALRGELVALLDQMEGHYGGDQARSGLAQRMRDLRYQVVESDPDTRRREALRSVKRQIDRFSDRSETDAADGAVMLQSAIAQIRARGPLAVESRPPPAAPAAPPAPRYDEMARTMGVLTQRLSELESELGAQRGNSAQVREIADQVGQLSHVVELLAGAVGDSGQMQRLEGQINELTGLVGRGPQVDLSQLTERLDQVAANVDRLADLQVQQIQHVVREAESGPDKDSETVRGMQTIESSIRSLYDRIDALESGMGAPAAELERVTDLLGQIATRMSTEGNRPDRLLGLVDALNGRIKEIEDTGYNLGSLRNDLEALREAVLGAVEPRFSAIEERLGELGERLDSRVSDGPGIAQVEAQIRQLVARMDQTGEQLALLAEQQAAVVPPDFEALASLAATRTAEALNRSRKEPDFDDLADRVAARTQRAIGDRAGLPPAEMEAMADLIVGRTRAALADSTPPSPAAPELSEASLAEIEDRVSRLVDGFLRAQAAADNTDEVSEGMQRVEDRLAQLEVALSRRSAEPAERPAEIIPAPQPEASFEPVATAAAIPAPPLPQPRPGRSVKIPIAPRNEASAPEAAPVNDMMPRDPAVEAPLKEFGFPDLERVRTALEARNGPRLPTARAAAAEAAPEVAITEAAPLPPAEPYDQPAYDPDAVEFPPRPQSIFDREVNSAFEQPARPAAASGPVTNSSRNTFIEAARRSAQRQNTLKTTANAESAIGRALSRLQTAKPEGVVVPEPVPAATATPAAKPEKKEKRGLLGRKARPKKTPEAKKAEPIAAAVMPEAITSPQDETVAPADLVADARPVPRESFLGRHRRAILLGASVVAIAFMTLNLVAQRLTPAPDDAMSLAPPTASAPQPATQATPTVSAQRPAPAAAAPSLAARPTSLIMPAALPVGAPVIPVSPGPGPGPRITPSVDSTVTASIAPDEGALAKDTPQSPMPAVLPAPAAAAASTDLPQTMPALATDASAPVADQSVPPALQSPVKVALPPDVVGPLPLRQAAANGDARSQFEIGAIYSEGKVVPQDFKQASVWYERAAEQGFAPAEYRLGNLYETGKGLTRDYEQAHLWYERAADAGNRMAMHNLAALFAGGQFGKQDFASAASWFEKAANLGIRDSQFNLGMLYARGLGVPQNLQTSYKWFALAASTGDSGAAKARDDVARSLDAEQLKDAKADVAAFKPGPVNLAANFAPIGTWDKTFNPGPTIAAKDVVLKVQQALLRLGYDVGTPDGHAGPKTAQAIKSFEQGTGMTQVGQINPRLLAVLGSQPV